MAKGKHGDYERIELPTEFSPAGKKLWLLLYRDKRRIKIAGSTPLSVGDGFGSVRRVQSAS